MPKLNFPEKFVWGAATSSHQVEGSNHNDWTEWEKWHAKRLAAEAPAKFEKIVPNWDEIKPEATNPANYISGLAADHYNRYKEDIAILKELNLNAYRFSLEWSRLEPMSNGWDQSVISHYRNVITELKTNNITPWITLWHRSLPLWVEKQGGWHNSETVENYIRFVKRVVTEYGGEVKLWMPLNEPEFEILGSYLGGNYPPMLRSPLKAFHAFKNLIKAHRLAYDVIHRLQTDAQVGVPHAALAVEAYQNKFINQILAKLVTYLFINQILAKLVTYLGNWLFLDLTKNHTDFIGVQYYTRGTINISLKAKNNYGIPFVEQIAKGLPKSDLGFEIDPAGIYPYLQDCWKRYGKPIVITENGLPDREDKFRAQFIKDILAQIHKAIQNGIDVRGYFHWSLLDNLEWDKGFWPKFGLVGVDRQTQKRTIRPSARTYAEIAKQNGLESTM